MAHERLHSPAGEIQVTATPAGLSAVSFDALPTDDHGPVARRIVADAVTQLQEYFAEARRHFELPLAPHGTDFQRAVWAALRTIEFGETRSYGELARALDSPGASRAVGAANGKNPIAIIVPCHRVIGADGRLTGYAGGLDKKRLLLRLEGHLV